MSMDSNLQSAFTTVGTAIKGKQSTLVSGTNIKTINGDSILGDGNLEVTISSITGLQTVLDSINTSLGDINSALDTINGEVI